MVIFFYPPVDQLSGYINAHAHVNSITIIRLFIRRESLQYLAKQEEELIPRDYFQTAGNNEIGHMYPLQGSTNLKQNLSSCLLSNSTWTCVL